VNPLIVDGIGYLGMVLILVSYFQKKRYKLHGVLAVACFVLLFYSHFKGDMVFVILNGLLAMINVLQFVRFTKEDK